MYVVRVQWQRKIGTRYYTFFKKRDTIEREIGGGALHGNQYLYVRCINGRKNSVKIKPEKKNHPKTHTGHESYTIYTAAVL